MAEKSEKATPHKLREARKKGQVAKSQDFPSVFTFVTAMSLVLITASGIFQAWTTFLTECFTSVGQSGDSIDTVPQWIAQGMYVILTTSLPLAMGVSAVGVLVNFLIIGPVFSVEVFKPDIKKFDPIKNLGQKFKMKTVVELLKSMFKILGAGYIMWASVSSHTPDLLATLGKPIIQILFIVSNILVEVIAKVTLFFAVIAVFDLVYQKRQFANQMKMEKFEIKQEHKNLEGNPEIKGKRRQLAQEMAYEDGPATGVKMSKAVITNPVEVAVAIGYAPERGLGAPYILAMGRGPKAERIKKLAEVYDKPVLQNYELAHILIEKGTLYNYVPKETFKMLADIIQWLESLEEK